MTDDPRAIRLFEDHHYDHPVNEEANDQSGSVSFGGGDPEASSQIESDARHGSVGFGTASRGSASQAPQGDPLELVGAPADPAPHPVSSSSSGSNQTVVVPPLSSPHRPEAGGEENTGVVGRQGAYKAPAGPTGSWDTPIPLEAPPTPLERFDADLLPSPVRDHVIDLAESNNLLIDQFLPSLFTALGGVIGNTWRMYPQARGYWEVILALWSLLVAPSGSKKSLPGKYLFEPVRAIDQRLHQERVAAEHAHEAQLTVLSMQVASVKKALEKAIQTGEEVDALQSRLASLHRELEAAQLPVRMVLLQDTTTEKLLETQRDNPRGVILARDEIGGFLDGLTKPGREGDLQYYLEGWNSAAPFKQSRIGRGHIHAASNTIAITGNIQPQVLTAYRRNVLGRGDGLLPRFQVLVHLDELPPFEIIDRPANKAAKKAYDKVITGLFNLDPKSRGFEAHGVLRFEDAAQERFNDWLRGLEERLREPKLRALPGFHEHLAKYRSLVPAVSGIYHLVDVVTTSAGYRVPLATLENAIETVSYLEQHARRVYHEERDQNVILANRLLDKLAGLEETTVTLRKLLRSNWSGLTSATLPRVITDLEHHGWVRRETKSNPGGGRPSEVIHLHPALRRLHQAQYN